MNVLDPRLPMRVSDSECAPWAISGMATFPWLSGFCSSADVTASPQINQSGANVRGAWAGNMSRSVTAAPPSVQQAEEQQLAAALAASIKSAEDDEKHRVARERAAYEALIAAQKTINETAAVASVPVLFWNTTLHFHLLAEGLIYLV